MQFLRPNSHIFNKTKYCNEVGWLYPLFMLRKYYKFGFKKSATFLEM